MNYKIIGKNITITEAIKATVLKKLSKFDKYFSDDRNIECRVVARSYKVGAKIEITIFTPQMDLRAEVTDDDLYNGIDKAMDKLFVQMRKLKSRMDRKKSGRISISESLSLPNVEALMNDLTDDEKDDNEEIVRSKSVFLSPMSIDEAISRMNAIDHPFFLYLDEETLKISVIYVRNDGGYGVIQAENEIK